MSRIYCGNNRLNEKLVSGTHNLGTRNQCFKKGRLVGLSLPYDVSYSLPYQPIDNTKIYCEDTIVLPNDYDRFGTIRECLQKGIGIGKRIKATNSKRRKRSQKFLRTKTRRNKRRKRSEKFLRTKRK